MKPEKVSLVCKHCGYQWEEPTAALVAAKTIVYRGDEAVVKRRLKCPNCDRHVIVAVPKAWLEHE